jgi:ribosome-binding protein aMBF1 (putative translation factor)
MQDWVQVSHARGTHSSAVSSAHAVGSSVRNAARVNGDAASAVRCRAIPGLLHFDATGATPIDVDVRVRISLQYQRMKLHMSVVHLANISGIDAQTIRAYESGKSFPTGAHLTALKQALHFDLLCSS